MADSGRPSELGAETLEGVDPAFEVVGPTHCQRNQRPAGEPPPFRVASQFVVVSTRPHAVVLASDNMYLYENLDAHKPISQTLDAASNLRTQDRMRTLASTPALVIPGHDPAVFDRFPHVNERIVRIE